MPVDIDPKYTETDVFSLEGLIQWLEMQPPETEYDFFDIWDCLLYRYARARGVKVHSAGSDNVAIDSLAEGYPRIKICPKGIAGDYPWTYGAALERARRLRDAV